MRYPLNQPVRVTTTVTDLNGNLTNATALSLTLGRPDATQQVYSSPVNDSTGLYHQDLLAADLAQLGHYQYQWQATGTGAGVSFGDFDVFDPFEPAVLSLQDAKQAANIPQATTTYDDELLGMVETVTAAMERLTGGPIINRTITERVKLVGYNENTFVLRQRPLVSVTSITNIASSQSIPLNDLDIDTVLGTIQRKRELPFWGWMPWYSIVYVAGWGTQVPPSFNQAARIIVNHLWASQRGPGLSLPPGIDGTLLPGMGFAIPNRAAELLAPYAYEVYV